MLQDPPPAAIEFLSKIREVMSIAKDKMTAKRFIPILSDIPEEDRYHAIDLGWDIPCARRGRRFSAISLKQENSRKSGHCGGCPGCDSSNRLKAAPLTRSNSCKSCVSEDYKQHIVRKWLDDVPLPQPTTPAPKHIKSVAKVSGTPRVIETKSKEFSPELEDTEVIEEAKVHDNAPKKLIIEKKDISKPAVEIKLTNLVEKNTKMSRTENTASDIKLTISNPIITLVTQPEKTSPSKHATRRVRKKMLPPPPPPPGKPPPPPSSKSSSTPSGKAPAPQPPQILKKEEPIPKEVKVKMEAVIKELHNCRRVEPIEIEEMKLETISPMKIAPKIVIPVLAADSVCCSYSDDNHTNPRKKKIMKDDYMDFDSLERTINRRRRFSLACEPESIYMNDFANERRSIVDRGRLTSSWLDMTKIVDTPSKVVKTGSVNEIFISQTEPLYDNIDHFTKPGPLTIQIRGSPVESRRNMYEDFDPDTLDRKPKHEAKKRVEKILLKSAGSFKQKSPSPEKDSTKRSPVLNSPNKIGNLRQIYEMKAKAQQEEKKVYQRRGSLQYGRQDLSDFMRALKTPDLIRHIEGQKEKPPVPPKARRGSDVSLQFITPLRESPPDRRKAEERDRFGAYTRAENLNARRSGRKSARTRSRRTDLRKLYRTEDSGYMSTDSNESKRRAKYLLQLRPKAMNANESNLIQVTRTVNKAPIAIESDTDDFESLCDGRSESGGESVETDSVFFGNFDDSKEMLAELGLNTFEPRSKLMQGHKHEQIDSGFMGETNIILSGDSDSEHRSVISIITGKDGRASSASIKQLEESPYHTIEC